MNKHTYNITNFDLDPIGTERKKHLGLLSMRFSTGEAYVVVEDQNGVRKEVLLQGEAYRRFLDFLSKNKIQVSIPSNINDVENMTHLYIDASTDIPDNMETVSVHDILLERTFDNLEEGSGLATVNTVTKKKLSRKTLAKDIEVIDSRKDKATNKILGRTDAESLLNYILNAPLDLDPVFSSSSNLRLLTDKNDKSTGFIRLELNTMDNPVTETDPEKFKDTLVTAEGAREIINKINTDIEAIRSFGRVSISSMNTAGVVTAKEIASKSNADILSFSADEATKLVIGVDSETGIYIRHARINDASVSIAYEAGKIIGIKSIKTDGYGHISEIETKDYHPEINELYYSKKEIDESYINKNNTGTEVMNGSLDILQKLVVRGKVKIMGDLITSGESSKENVKQMLIKDLILDIGAGNDAADRYVGIRLVKANPVASGAGSKDAFIVFDKVDSRFKFIHARVSATNQNNLYDIELADIEAGNIGGIASSANRFNKALKLLFTGDVTGSGEFFGDEGIKEIELTVRKATSTAFGVVKLLDSLPSVPPEEPATVFSAAYLYDLLRNFKTFDTYNGYDSESTTLIATANAVNSVYNKLVEFRSKYDAKAQEQEAEAEKARTILIDRRRHSYNTSISLDIATMTPVVSGKGYDARKYDNNIPMATQYPEAWSARYVLSVKPLASRVLFTVASRLSNIERLSLPKINKAAMPGFVFGSKFIFKIYEYEDSVSPTGVEVYRTDNDDAYNMGDEYKEIDFSAADSNSTIYSNKFRNVMSMLELMSYQGTNQPLFRDNTTEYITFVSPNSNDNAMLTAGTFTNIYEDPTGPFNGAPEPVISINGMEFNTMTGDNIKLNASLAYSNNDSKYAHVTLTADAKDLNPRLPHMMAFYFKIDKKYSNLAPNRQGRINANVDTIVFKNGTYVKETKTIVPWSETNVAKMSGLVNGKWYLAVGFIGDGLGQFVDSGGLRGIYDVLTKTKVASFNNPIHFANYSDPIASSTFKLSFQGMDIKVGSTLFGEFQVVQAAKLVDELLSGNKILAFKKAINTTSYNKAYNMNPVTPTKYYTITCETLLNSFKPDKHPFSEYTTFGSDATSLETLIPENDAEDGLDYLIDSGKDYSVKMHLAQTAEVLDPGVIPDVWLTPVENYQAISQKYLDPRRDDVISVAVDRTVPISSPRYGKETLYKYDGSKWVFLREFVDMVELPSVSTEAELIKYYTIPPNGSYMKITNDSTQNDTSTIYYRRNGAWEFLIKATNVKNTGSEANLAALQARVGPAAPVNYDMAVALDSGIMYIYIIDEWVDYGDYQGWTYLSTEVTYANFKNKYKIPQENDFVRVTDITMSWYLYDGTMWVNKGEYVSYNYTNIRIGSESPLTETEEEQISNRIKKFYVVPKNNELVKVNTSQASTATYYKYAAASREWNYMALYSTYQEKYQNKLLSGTVSLSEGTLSHEILVSYKYITAN